MWGGKLLKNGVFLTFLFLFHFLCRGILSFGHSMDDAILWVIIIIVMNPMVLMCGCFFALALINPLIGNHWSKQFKIEPSSEEKIDLYIRPSLVWLPLALFIYQLQVSVPSLRLDPSGPKGYFDLLFILGFLVAGWGAHIGAFDTSSNEFV